MTPALPANWSQLTKEERIAWLQMVLDAWAAQTPCPNELQNIIDPHGWTEIPRPFTIPKEWQSES